MATKSRRSNWFHFSAYLLFVVFLSACPPPDKEQNAKAKKSPEPLEMRCYVFDVNDFRLADAEGIACEDIGKTVTMSFYVSPVPQGFSSRTGGKYITLDSDTGDYHSTFNYHCYFTTSDCSGTCFVGSDSDRKSWELDPSRLTEGAFYDGEAFHVWLKEGLTPDPVEPKDQAPYSDVKSQYKNGLCERVEEIPSDLYLPTGKVSLNLWPVKGPLRLGYDNENHE